MVVSLSLSKTQINLLRTVLVKPRKRWLRPDMTEKMLSGTLNLKITGLITSGEHYLNISFIR